MTDERCNKPQPHNSTVLLAINGVHPLADHDRDELFARDLREEFADYYHDFVPSLEESGGLTRRCDAPGGGLAGRAVPDPGRAGTAKPNSGTRNPPLPPVPEQQEPALGGHLLDRGLTTPGSSRQQGAVPVGHAGRRPADDFEALLRQAISLIQRAEDVTPPMHTNVEMLVGLDLSTARQRIGGALGHLRREGVTG